MPTPSILGVPCWVLPIFAGTAWLITLITLLASWVVKGSTHYPEMWRAQHLAYISNVGASQWGRHVFTAGSVITAVSLAAALMTERWMRHMGRLLHVSTRLMTAMSIVTAILLVAAFCSLIFLTVFDVRGRPLVHYPLVSIFVFGSILSAALMLVERKVISMHYPTSSASRYSFHIKLFLILSEVILVLICGITMYQRHYRVSVVAEWLIALFFTFYIWTFALDFFATPGTDRMHGKVELVDKYWDEEAGVVAPKKIQVRTLYRPYILLP